MQNFFCRGCAVVSYFKHDARLIGTVNVRGRLDSSSVNKSGIRIKDVGPQLALGGASSLSPLNYSCDGDDGRYCTNMVLDKIAEGGKSVPKTKA